MNQAQISAAVASLAPLYEELYESLQVWKYGPVIDIVDPLGTSGNLSASGHLVRLVRPGRALGDRTEEELENIEEKFQAFATVFNSLPGGIRATLTYTYARPGDEFNPDLQVDVFVPQMLQNENNIVAKVYWYGIARLTKSYVMCDYDNNDIGLAFHQFIMSAQIPFSLKAYLFSWEGVKLIPDKLKSISSSEFIQRGLFHQSHTRQSLALHLMNNVTKNSEIRNIANYLVSSWLQTFDSSAPPASQYGVQRSVQQQQSTSSLVSRALQPASRPGVRRREPEEDDDIDEVPASTLQGRVLQSTRRDRAGLPPMGSSPKRWTKDEDFHATIGDLVTNKGRNCKSLAPVCTIVEIWMIFLHATGLFGKGHEFPKYE
jgi:hypothetical protein